MGTGTRIYDERSSAMGVTSLVHERGVGLDATLSATLSVGLSARLSVGLDAIGTYSLSFLE